MRPPTAILRRYAPLVYRLRLNRSASTNSAPVLLWSLRFFADDIVIMVTRLGRGNRLRHARLTAMFSALILNSLVVILLRQDRLSQLTVRSATILIEPKLVSVYETSLSFEVWRRYASMARLDSMRRRLSPLRTSSATVLTRNCEASPGLEISPDLSRKSQAISTEFSTRIGRGSNIRKEPLRTARVPWRPWFGRPRSGFGQVADLDGPAAAAGTFLHPARLRFIDHMIVYGAAEEDRFY